MEPEHCAEHWLQCPPGSPDRGNLRAAVGAHPQYPGGGTSPAILTLVSAPVTQGLLSLDASEGRGDRHRNPSPHRVNLKSRFYSLSPGNLSAGRLLLAPAWQGVD